MASMLYWYLELKMKIIVINVQISPTIQTIHRLLLDRTGTSCVAKDVKITNCATSDDQSIFPHDRMGYLQKTHPISLEFGMSYASKQFKVESGTIVNNCAIENAEMRSSCADNALAGNKGLAPLHDQITNVPRTHTYVQMSTISRSAICSGMGRSYPNVQSMNNVSYNGSSDVPFRYVSEYHRWRKDTTFVKTKFVYMTTTAVIINLVQRSDFAEDTEDILDFSLWRI